ncbi:PAS domain-containing protein [Fibrella sp. WM1]|uniref:PAS domain-containing protein n=1 Tax=Fibrella musci TaxID=3242485 RepID=UPI00351FD17F
MNDAQLGSAANRPFTQRHTIDFALGAAGLGIWEYDPLADQVQWDDRCLEIFGFLSRNPSYQEVIDRIHPDDVARVDQVLQRTMHSPQEEAYDQTYRIFRADTGQLRWVRTWGKSHLNSEGTLLQLIGVAQDVTEQVLSEQSQKQVLALFEQSPVGIAIIDEAELTFQTANPFYGYLVGRSPQQLVGKPLLEALPELAGQGFDQLLRGVIATGTPFIASEVKVDLVRNKLLETIYVDLAYQPWRNATGRISGVLVVATDVTQQVQTRQRLQESTDQIRVMVESAPFPIGVYTGPEMNIRFANQAIIDVYGKGPDVIGKNYPELLPELAGQRIFEQLQQVYTTGVPFASGTQRVDIDHGGNLVPYYFNYNFTPLFDANGQVYGVMNTGADVTELETARRQLAESEARFRSLIEEAPVATCLFVGRDLRIEVANDTMIGYWGKDQTVIGKPLIEAVPELAGQPFIQLLDEVFTTGKTIELKAGRAQLEVGGTLGTYYFDFTYKPLRNAAGDVYAIMDMAVDVTQQELARQALAENEVALSNAVELAELGTWTLDIATGTTKLSQRHADMFGLGMTHLPYETALAIVHPDDRDWVQTAFEQALQPGSSGQYQAEYRIINAHTKQQQLIRARGQATFDIHGKPLRIAGITQDVTLDRQLQLALENEVQNRTQELAEANTLLTHSNDNLQQFAYVASHDLQEPLRKIQAFGDILKTQYAAGLGEGADLLERMQAASSRMSILIRDLLNYSRITTRREADAPVPLNQVVSAVLTDLELIISETGAQLHIGPLPTVTGDQGQLGQLFQNLLANAMKFHRSGTPPIVDVRSQLVAAEALPTGVRPARLVSTYYRLDVIDNGIGFDQKYADRIFQVFQRLHGKQQFAGTGIGLAICEKVVVNHGGAIMATSQPGQGATFSIYLPA